MPSPEPLLITSALCGKVVTVYHQVTVYLGMFWNCPQQSVAVSEREMNDATGSHPDRGCQGARQEDHL